MIIAVFYGGYVATVTSMAERLRYELGDIGRSFVYQFVADGITNRFLIPYSPLDGANLVINQEGDDVSSTVEVEEAKLQAHELRLALEGTRAALKESQATVREQAARLRMAEHAVAWELDRRNAA
jgi:hypothetical protein